MRIHERLFLSVFSVVLLFATLLQAQNFPQVRFLPVITGLDRPVHITHAGDGSGRLFVVEQTGRIRILRDNSLLSAPFLDLRDRVSCCGERGLLSAAFPPNFASSRHFFVNYTDRGGNTVIARYQVSGNPDAADPNSERILLTIQQPFANHNGGLLKFSPRDGHLYIASGDGGGANDPLGAGQDRRSLLGKLLRIQPGESGASGPYLIPPGNPFVGNATALPEIWAWGLRNPWKFSFDRNTGDLFIADVGQNALEEVNFQPAASQGGENYGWNTMEGSQCFRAPCSTAGLTLPVTEYPHAGGDCSVTGGYVYRGRRYPALNGIYIYGDYCSGRIRGLRRTGAGWVSQVLVTTPYRIATFGEDESGELYLGDIAGGGLYVLASTTPITSAAGVVDAASFQPGIVAGSLASLFGSGLSSAFGTLLGGNFPLPRQLAGAAVLLDGVRAPLVGVAAGAEEQINFQVPWELAGRAEVTLQVETHGPLSEPLRIPLSPAAPALFTYGGGNAAAPLNLAAALFAGTASLVGEASPAAAGDLISLFATGLGTVTNAPPSGAAAPSSPLAQTQELPVVTIDGLSAEVLFSGLAPGFAGLYQINVRIPAGVRAGNRDVRVRISGRQSVAAQLPLRGA